ncbi:MAG: pseudouridine synthase [Eubacteriales bacterium]
MRIDKLFSAAGLLTRSECAKASRQGRIAVDGVVVKRCDIHVDPNINEIKLDGTRVEYSEHVYILMNKPAGYVSSTDDPRDETVLKLLPERFSRLGLFPVGRLDKDTTGLLVLTDDGVLAHELLSPKKHVKKKYLASLARPITDADIRYFAEGLTIDGGELCRPALLERADNPSFAYVTLTEGKFHQVKRMFAATDNSVSSLERVEFGGLRLDTSMKRGEWRELTEDELRILRNR